MFFSKRYHFLLKMRHAFTFLSFSRNFSHRVFFNFQKFEITSAISVKGPKILENSVRNSESFEIAGAYCMRKRLWEQGWEKRVILGLDRNL